MYTPTELGKTVFFDLETASEFSSLDELAKVKPKLAELWSKRCEYLRNRFEENRDMTDEELYLSKAALTPEFARIVCATFGRITYSGDQPNAIIKSYCSTDEREVLDGITKVFEKFAILKFSGHNIKRFDIPMMCKRLLINGYSLPKGLQIQNLKPWEMPFIDTSEVWSFGAWQEGFVSLDLLTAAIGIPSPKSDIKGEDVTRVFWEDRDTNRISEYCQRDVFAGMQSLLKLSNLAVVEDFETQL
jgi:DNA polymerase elongation subunit (family B)